MKLFFKNKNKQGFAMIEVIVSIGIISILIVAFEGLVFQSIKMNRINEYEFQANMYLREAIEIAKDLEQSAEGWGQLTSLSCIVACHPVPPVVEGGAWTLALGSDNSGLYTRTISIKSVWRDEMGFPNNIVDSGGIYDENTKKVIATIEWDNGLASRSLETYVYK